MLGINSCAQLDTDSALHWWGPTVRNSQLALSENKETKKLCAALKTTDRFLLLFTVLCGLLCLSLSVFVFEHLSPASLPLPFSVTLYVSHSLTSLYLCCFLSPKSLILSAPSSNFLTPSYFFFFFLNCSYPEAELRNRNAFPKDVDMSALREAVGKVSKLTCPMLYIPIELSFCHWNRSFVP